MRHIKRIFPVNIQHMKVNSASSTRGVSGELDISQFSVVCHFHDFSRSIQSCRILTYVFKILQNIRFTRVYIYIYTSIFPLNNYFESYHRSFFVNYDLNMRRKYYLLYGIRRNGLIKDFLLPAVLFDHRLPNKDGALVSLHKDNCACSLLLLHSPVQTERCSYLGRESTLFIQLIFKHLKNEPSSLDKSQIPCHLTKNTDGNNYWKPEAPDVLLIFHKISLFQQKAKIKIKR